MDVETWDGFRFVAKHLRQKFYAGRGYIAQKLERQMHIFSRNPADERIEGLTKVGRLFIDVLLDLGWDFNSDEGAQHAHGNGVIPPGWQALARQPP